MSKVVIVVLAALLLAIGLFWSFHHAGQPPKQAAQPQISPLQMPNPADFVDEIDNKYFPLLVGTTFVYEAETDEGTERGEVVVTAGTRRILGVTCVVVRDRVTVNGELREETYDWYAQDKAVWYFGEDTREYEGGVAVSTAGSWEAGVNGAQQGIIMEASPKVGDAYRQERAKGVAEDMAEVLSLKESASVPYGSFDNLLMTREWSPLNPDIVEHKYYAAGVGQVLTVMVKGGSEQSKLVEIRRP